MIKRVSEDKLMGKIEPIKEVGYLILLVVFFVRNCTWNIATKKG